ncbi:MAG: rod shape-determining protein MreC [Acidobacteriaceae bacterium]
MRFIYSKNFVRLFVIFLLIAGFIIGDKLGALNFVKEQFFRIYTPSLRTVSAVTGRTRDFFKAIVVIQKLASENAQLNQRIDELSFENARLKQARQENITLRKSLNLSVPGEYSSVAVEVTFLDPTGFSRTISINKGDSEGIRVGQAVAVAPGLLVGRVTKTYTHNSEVTLITDPGILINAEVSDTGARGLVRGEHGLGLAFELVTQNEVIKTGDQVVTSGLGSDFPPGLLIGEIVGIKSSASELFQKAYVSPAAELRNLRFLYVIQ